VACCVAEGGDRRTGIEDIGHRRCEMNGSIDASWDKVSDLASAAALVHDGDTLALGGMTLYRRPVAFVRALLQRATPPRDLTLLCFTAGFESDLLVGVGSVLRVRSCYFGLEAFGLAPMFTQAAMTGALQIVEETEASLAFGLRATLAGVGFMPGRGWLGTDMLKVRPDVQVIADPYTGEDVVAFPAVTCDVAVIHALRADRVGNAVLGGNLAVDVELSLVAERVIVTAEEIADRLEGPVDLGGLSVTAVVHAPRGAWPTSCYPRYPVGGEELMRYAESCPGGFEEYLSGFVAQDGKDPGLPQ
jgi:glutaconate CoA-transferase subunit A